MYTSIKAAVCISSAETRAAFYFSANVCNSPRRFWYSGDPKNREPIMFSMSSAVLGQIHRPPSRAADQWSLIHRASDRLTIGMPMIPANDPGWSRTRIYICWELLRYSYLCISSTSIDILSVKTPQLLLIVEFKCLNRLPNDMKLKYWKSYYITGESSFLMTQIAYSNDIDQLQLKSLHHDKR